MTTCEIDLDGSQLVGSAYCSIKDVFSKEKGRRVSMAKALQEIQDRNIRRVFWMAYFDRFQPRDIVEQLA